MVVSVVVVVVVAFNVVVIVLVSMYISHYNNNGHNCLSFVQLPAMMTNGWLANNQQTNKR